MDNFTTDAMVTILSQDEVRSNLRNHKQRRTIPREIVRLRFV